MNTYYRLELAFFDEPQGCGFLHGLEDIGLSEKTSNKLLAAFDSLPRPECTESVSFWFTKAGLLKFRKAICDIQEAIEPLGWSIYAATLNAAADGDASIIYSDEYQVAFLRSWVQAKKLEYVTPWQELMSNKTHEEDF